MTHDDIVAVSECARLIQLLLASKSPQAKSLGLIVVTRISAIGEHGVGKILSEEDAEAWCELANKNAWDGRPN